MKILALLLLLAHTAFSDTVTAYCDGTVTAAGTRPRAGITIAGPRRIPLGTWVEIGGHRYRVEDRTHKRFDGRWDIYMTDRQEALKFGKQELKVKVLK